MKDSPHEEDGRDSTWNQGQDFLSSQVTREMKRMAVLSIGHYFVVLSPETASEN